MKKYMLAITISWIVLGIAMLFTKIIFCIVVGMFMACVGVYTTIAIINDKPDA